MFAICHKVDRPILRYDFLRYTQKSFNLANEEISKIYTDIPRGDIAISLKIVILIFNS